MALNLLVDEDTSAGSEAVVSFTAMTSENVLVEISRKTGTADQVYVLSATNP